MDASCSRKLSLDASQEGWNEENETGSEGQVWIAETPLYHVWELHGTFKMCSARGTWVA